MQKDAKDAKGGVQATGTNEGFRRATETDRCASYWLHDL